jgi:gamma-glutamyltranspeptidase/glutathione hydrolase
MFSGGFLLLHDHKSHASWSFDFRETAPKDAQSVDDQQSITKSGARVGVPGTLRAAYMIHTKYGKSKWSSLVQVALDICTTGVVVTQELCTFVY